MDLKLFFRLDTSSKEKFDSHVIQFVYPQEKIKGRFPSYLSENKKAFELLLRAKADINLCSTIFVHSILYGEMDTFNYLVQQGIDVHYKNNLFFEMAVEILEADRCPEERVEILKILLSRDQKGVDLNELLVSFCSRKKRRYDRSKEGLILQFLIEQKADVKSKVRNRFTPSPSVVTPLEMAILQKNTDLVDHLSSFL
jgi:hypothetical protein